MAARLSAARAGDQHEFSGLTEPYRRELQLHCYRILGSLQDAEDMVQETMLRAWRRLDTFEGRASLRAWLYKIATNACLDALDKRRRRSLPAARYPAADPAQPPAPPVEGLLWLEPYPDEWLPEAAASPEARYVERETVSFAFLAALQALPPRQRAVLILRDVLEWRASEAADILGATVSVVNSALHRARVKMAKHYHGTRPEEVKAAPADDRTRRLLDRYVEAWEAADVAGLVSLLKEDATFTMPPSPTWYRGRDAIGAAAAANIFEGEARGRWRLHPTQANGRPGFAVYRRGPSGAYQAFGIQVLTFDGERLADVTTFLDPSLFSLFRLPSEIAA